MINLWEELILEEKREASWASKMAGIKKNSVTILKLECVDFRKLRAAAFPAVILRNA